jgi:hypothetical protein
MNEWQKTYTDYFENFSAPCMRCKVGYGRFERLVIDDNLKFIFYCRACGEWFVHIRSIESIRGKDDLFYMIFKLAGRSFHHGHLKYITNIKKYKEVEKNHWRMSIWQKIKNLMI